VHGTGKRRKLKQDTWSGRMRAGRAVRIVPSAKLWAWPPSIAIATAVCHECPYKLSAMLNVACVCPQQSQLQHGEKYR